ncbi:N-acetyl-gamma-glutamyl-phosphate reductase [bacterium]|nr:N-acetyl-gamma-glutamyl-phosphate reductase [bacterium]
MIKVGVVGATGYTGTECVRLLMQHPEVSEISVFANSLAGESTYSYFGQSDKLPTSFMQFSEDVDYALDCLFLAIPHQTSHSMMPALRKHAYKIIDLSADFRLNSSDLYHEYYNVTHQSSNLLTGIPYGLSEYYAADIAKASCVANPGCFAISSILALKPFTDTNKAAFTVIDAKSGASGAGKSSNETFMYCEVNEQIRAYNTNQHRHMAELTEQCSSSILFSPHVVPMNRGILTACYIQTTTSETIDSVLSLYQDVYKHASFVRVMQQPMPSTKSVVGTNMCELSIQQVTDTHVVVFSAIDNLIKGASGNAIQLMNIMFNLDEKLGLPQIPHRV